MSFVTLVDFSQLAVSLVVRAHLEGDRVSLETAAGYTFMAEQGAWERALKFDIRGVIPALPGYFVLDQCGGEDGQTDYLDTEPVIGWAINAAGRATPVTPGGVDEYDRATLRPDGKVQHLDGTYDNRALYAEILNVRAFPQS
tara:strand:+ start:846 stop:1271 length:426 start_codon:yes stop_codon:yes gene_type:complete